MRDDRTIPQWAKTAIIVLEVLSVISFAVVLFFMDDISSFLIDHVGTTAVIVGIAYCMFADHRGEARRSLALRFRPCDAGSSGYLPSWSPPLQVYSSPI